MVQRRLHEDRVGEIKGREDDRHEHNKHQSKLNDRVAMAGVALQRIDRRRVSLCENVMPRS
jgi:hypothetical protein